MVILVGIYFFLPTSGEASDAIISQDIQPVYINKDPTPDTTIDFTLKEPEVVKPHEQMSSTFDKSLY